MSTYMLPLIYPPIDHASALQADPSAVVYRSMDRVNFDIHLSPTYGSHSIYDLSAVLPELYTSFLIRSSNLYIARAIDSAPCPQGQVDLDMGSSVQVVNEAHDLTQYRHCEAVFIRADNSLVIWGDDEHATVRLWYDIFCGIQRQFGTAIPTTIPAADLLGNDGNIPGDELPYLDDFADLFNFADCLSQAPTNPSWQQMTSAEPSEGSLGFTLLQRVRSPFSDVTSSSILDSPSTTDLEGIFSSFPPSVCVGEEDEVGSNFPLFIGDRDVSPALPSYCTVPISAPFVPEQASSSSSTHPHSAAETGAPESFAHGIGQKATREDEEAGYHFPQPISINVNSSTSEAATGNADVDLRGSASNTRVLKRTHSVIGIGSAPALLTTPLPDVQPEDEKRRKFLAIAPAPPPASASASKSTSTPIFAPAPTFPSPTSTPASAGKPPRRTGKGRRNGGTSSGKNPRGKRHPCEYCGKTFTRLQDQHRHTTTSCNASPLKSTVDCPECGAILSRLDAAQRHWRNHENPKCETPEWVSSRS